MSNIGHEAAPLSRQNLREFATYVRERFGYATIAYVDIEALLDFVLPTALPAFQYAICPESEMGNNHGLANPDERWIKLREDVHARACEGHGRDRMTVIHELGHVLLHTRDRVMLRRGDGPPRAYKDPEWQADCFAGEFLISHRLALDCKSPDDLVRRFGVTPSAARVQWNAFRSAGIV